MMAAIILPLLLAANPYNATFDRATEAYRAGDRDLAIRLYEQLVAEGVADAAVFYNLGNLYAETGRLGAAIAQYERALRQAPRFDNAAHNLRKCVSETRRHLDRPAPTAGQERVFFWHSAIPPGTSRALALISWFALWILLGLRQLCPWRYLRRGAAAAAVLALVFGGTAWTQAHPTPRAVVDRDDVPVRAEARDDSETRFRFYEGDRVRIERSGEGWLLVETALGERGWVRSEDLILVGPPFTRPAERPSDSPRAHAAPAAPVGAPETRS